MRDARVGRWIDKIGFRKGRAVSEQRTKPTRRASRVLICVPITSTHHINLCVDHVYLDGQPFSIIRLADFALDTILGADAFV